MLARLQQAITLGLVAVAVLWGFVFARAGETAWAVLGVLLIVFGYALVLGAEGLAAWRANRRDPAPAARVSEALAAWGGEVIAAPRVFCWRQPFRSNSPQDMLDGPGRRGMLLVHGFVCNRAFWSPWMKALRARGVPYMAVNLEPVFGGIDEYIDGLDAAWHDLRAGTGQLPLIVAHSMGGLAVRAWAVHRAMQPQVVTIGTPHAGTALARFAFSANGRQMRRDSRWLADLQARERAQRPDSFRHYTCFYSHCDNIVFPASSACLAGADNRHVRAAAHVHLAFVPEVFEAALVQLSRPPGA